MKSLTNEDGEAGEEESNPNTSDHGHNLGVEQSIDWVTSFFKIDVTLIYFLFKNGYVKFH